jgi:MoaA/NifB/PqqE/SkfB family radical SAM enzyme
MTQALTQGREWAAELGLDLVWDLPVPFSAHHPIRLDAPEAVEGGGRAWLYVEPDGDVLPSQGVDDVWGNILRDPWPEIWRHAKGTAIRPA